MHLKNKIRIISLGVLYIYVCVYVRVCACVRVNSYLMPGDVLSTITRR